MKTTNESHSQMDIHNGNSNLRTSKESINDEEIDKQMEYDNIFKLSEHPTTSTASAKSKKGTKLWTIMRMTQLIPN